MEHWQTHRTENEKVKKLALRIKQGISQKKKREIKIFNKWRTFFLKKKKNNYLKNNIIIQRKILKNEN